mgnify:CR=1 FL=1
MKGDNCLKSDTFTEGVSYGGLKNDYEIKILICYLLWKVEQKMTFEQLTACIQKDCVANYFEFAEAVAELVKAGNITSEINEYGAELFSIAELGIQTANTFEKNLPLSVREKTLRSAQNILTKARREKENIVEFEKVEDGYNLKIQMKDVGSDLLTLSVFVPTLRECEEFKKRFINNPQVLYQGVMALLTGDLSLYESLIISNEDLFD